MKRCPTCDRRYTDNTLSFCLQDGTQLVPDYDPDATVVTPSRPTAPPVKRSGSHRFYQIIVVWLVLIVAVGGLGLYITLSKRSERPDATATPAPDASRTDPIALVNNTNAHVAVSPSPTTSPTPSDQPAIPKIYDKTYDVARKLLIKEGWLPNKQLPIHGQDVEVQSGNGPIFWERGYWELEACSGTGLANCLFEFTDPTGRLLEVVTEGEEDEAGTYHARVSRVYLKKK